MRCQLVKVFLRLSSIVLLVCFTGCAVDVLNIKDAPIKTISADKGLSLDEITKAIVVAGMGMKWDMDVVSPGHVLGTLNLRSHQAVVDITYDTKTYSITYNRSKNVMMVDEFGKPVGIHPNYNGWIENLDRAIRTQFVAASH